MMTSAAHAVARLYGETLTAIISVPAVPACSPPTVHSSEEWAVLRTHGIAFGSLWMQTVPGPDPSRMNWRVLSLRDAKSALRVVQ